MLNKFFIAVPLLSWIVVIGCESSELATSFSEINTPQINSIEPDSGRFGTLVTIEGERFSAIAERMIIRINNVEAEITKIENETIKVLVPKGARTGPVSISVEGETIKGPIFNYILTVSVTTQAGNSIEGYMDGESGDARFNQPWGIEISEAGNIYTADFQNSVIRKIGPGQTVTTLSEGRLDHPMGLVLAPNGRFYVADAFNNMIKSMTLDGDVTQFAGSGAIGERDGEKTQASFNLPADIAVKSNLTVYVADAFNNKIRVIKRNGIVSTLAGTRQGGYRDGIGLSARFLRPGGLALSPDQSTLYVTDFLNHRIRTIDLSNGRVNTLAGDGTPGFKDGPVGEARFNGPFGITVDFNGTIYVADSKNHLIRMIKENTVTTLAGSGIAGHQDGTGLQAQFNEPYHIVISRNGGSVMYIADRRNNVIRRITLE